MRIAERCKKPQIGIPVIFSLSSNCVVHQESMDITQISIARKKNDGTQYINEMINILIIDFFQTFWT